MTRETFIKELDKILKQANFIEELEKIKMEIEDIKEPDYNFEGFNYGIEEALKIIDKHIEELKGGK